MNNNHNLSFEKNTPPNQIEGVLRAHLNQIYNAKAFADVSLLPVVRAEMKRTAEMYTTKAVNPAIESVVAPNIRPTATEMLAQVATASPEQPTSVSDENILADNHDNPAVMADDLRKYIDTLHEDERRAA
jgi:hypothetical protein